MSEHNLQRNYENSNLFIFEPPLMRNYFFNCLLNNHVVPETNHLKFLGLIIVGYLTRMNIQVL